MLAAPGLPLDQGDTQQRQAVLLAFGGLSDPPITSHEFRLRWIVSGLPAEEVKWATLVSLCIHR